MALRVVCVVSFKGGVGKTTVVSNLCPALVDLLRRRYGPRARLLVVDADTQCGATATMTDLDPGLLSATVATVLTGKHTLREAVLDLDDPDGRLPEHVARARAGVSLLPSNEHARVRVEDEDGLWVLRELLADSDELPEDIEMVLIDCGYGDTDLTELAIVASDALVTVVVPNLIDAHGLNVLMRKVRRLNERFGHVHLAGVIVNRYSREDVADEEVLNDLTDQLGERLWTPVLPSSAAIKRANNQHLPLAHYHPLQPALVASFAALAAQLLPEAARTGRHRQSQEET